MGVLPPDIRRTCAVGCCGGNNGSLLVSTSTSALTLWKHTVGQGSNSSVSFWGVFTLPALRVLLLLFLHPLYGHNFLRDVVLDEPPLLPSALQQQPENPQALCLCDIHYLDSAAPRLQPTERRHLHNPHQHRGQQWQHVQEHHGKALRPTPEYSRAVSARIRAFTQNESMPKSPWI